MKLLLVGLLFLAISAAAQTTTYTTTKDTECGKAPRFCQIPVLDKNNVPGYVTIDNRYPSRTGYVDLGTFGVNEYHGTYSGFVPNPDRTTTPFYGSGSYESDNGTVQGTFLFYAYYVRTCSGRACGGTLGWHYRVLIGSTVTVR